MAGKFKRAAALFFALGLMTASIVPGVNTMAEEDTYTEEDTGSDTTSEDTEEDTGSDTTSEDAAGEDTSYDDTYSSDTTYDDTSYDDSSEYDTTYDDSSDTYDDSYSYDTSYDSSSSSSESSTDAAATDTPVAIEDAMSTAPADPESVTTNAIPGWPQAGEIASTAAALMEVSTGTILYSKNMDTPMYPGATVKIMTILLALENCSLDEEVTMTDTGISGVIDGYASVSAQLGEVFTMEQCLYAIMLASANDMALQVAEYVGGSVEDFVQMMNDYAAELGCTDTVFTNPTGLSDENQHTTAHDMALIMAKAMEYEDFQTISGRTSYTITATNMSEGERVLTNSFGMVLHGNPYYYDGCLGGKTGFTDASGSTLVCAAQKDKMQLIAVVLQGTENLVCAEAINLFNYGYDNFQMKEFGQGDFDLVSGGIVLSPKDAQEADFETSDTSADENGNFTRTYLYNGMAMGTAQMQSPEEEDNSTQEASAANIQKAKDYSDHKSSLPYILIGVGGAMILLLAILGIYKVVKS